MFFRIAFASLSVLRAFAVDLCVLRAFDESLFAVTAIAPNNAWAVGDNGQTQHWNGMDWSRVAAPYPGLGGRLHGIDAASARDIWAAGTYNDGSQWRTWIDRYTVP